MDAATLTIFNHLFASVAEEMGVTLGRTAYSPTSRERLDYSCAAFPGRPRPALFTGPGGPHPRPSGGNARRCAPPSSSAPFRPGATWSSPMTPPRRKSSAGYYVGVAGIYQWSVVSEQCAAPDHYFFSSPAAPIMQMSAACRPPRCLPVHGNLSGRHHHPAHQTG